MKTTPKPPSPICSSSLYGPIDRAGPLGGRARSTVATGPAAGRLAGSCRPASWACEQRLDPAAQGRVAAAGLVQEGRAARPATCCSTAVEEDRLRCVGFAFMAMPLACGLLAVQCDESAANVLSESEIFQESRGPAASLEPARSSQARA